MPTFGRDYVMPTFDRDYVMPTFDRDYVAGTVWIDEMQPPVTVWAPPEMTITSTVNTVVNEWVPQTYNITADTTVSYYELIPFMGKPVEPEPDPEPCSEEELKNLLKG